jgi:protein-L-isoaspartate(D-aspartate) O-methyltransferase
MWTLHEDELVAARDRMVERQVMDRGICDPAILDAMRSVPRHGFVPPPYRHAAYADEPLPIGSGQTISQPYIVALMIALAEVKPSDRVLEIGTGSGYAAAILSRIAAEVFSIERDPELAGAARNRLIENGFGGVNLRRDDGTLGWPEAQPFDAILVAAGGPSVPEPLKSQLAPGGRLVMPCGPDLVHQRLVKVTRTAAGFAQETHDAVLFVPLVGEHAWKEGAKR